MSADLSNVITVSLLPQGKSLAFDNMNVVSIMTSQQTGPLSTANRYEEYRNLTDVGTDFGTESDVYAFASAFFSTTPNPIGADGTLLISYWRGATEAVAATAATLTGEELSEVTTIDLLQSITDGAFDIDVDGSTENITGLDFSTATELDDVITALNAKFSGATASLSGTKIVITSDTTGASSTLTKPADPGTGTFVGTLLGLTDGATLVQGAASDSLSAETKEDAVNALLAAANVKGLMFIDQPTGSEAEDLAALAQSESILMYDVFSDASNLTVSTSNACWNIKLAGNSNYRMLYSKAGNRKLAASYMARMHTVNFNAANSALTMQLKTLSVPPEDYTQAEITSAKKIGLDIYTTLKEETAPALLTSGANDFTDNRYNLISYIDAVQTTAANTLKTTSTKVPQTLEGVQTELAALKAVSRRYVRAGVFAPGTWTSPDTFGNVEVFKRSIETNGFYWLAGQLADQPNADREARKSPVLQNAVKNAGAIHSASIIINFNL